MATVVQSSIFPMWVQTISIDQSKEFTAWCHEMFEEHFPEQLPSYIKPKLLRKSFQSWVMFDIDGDRCDIDIEPFLQYVVPFKSCWEAGGFAATVYTVPTWLRLHVASVASEK